MNAEAVVRVAMEGSSWLGMKSCMTKVYKFVLFD